MKKIDFSQTGGFPLDTDVLAFMQNAYDVFNSLGEIAGDLAILKGCEVTGNNVTSGVVYINGEVLPLKGGTLSENVVITTTETPLIFEDGTSKKVLFERQVEFGGVGNVYKWADFHRINNLKELFRKIENHTHEWGNISGKPSAYPPSKHSHEWSDISGKPSSYTPSKHTHKMEDISDFPQMKARVVVAGRIGYNPRRVVKKYVGDFSVRGVSGKENWLDYHVIEHNLGHTDYIVTGQCLSAPLIKLNCYQINENSCVITTSDDASGNASDFDFMITAFK